MNIEEGMSNEQTAVFLKAIKILLESGIQEVEENGSTEKLKTLLQLLEESVTEIKEA